MRLAQFNVEAESVYTPQGGGAITELVSSGWVLEDMFLASTIKTFTGKQRVGVLYQSSWSTNFHMKKSKLCSCSTYRCLFYTDKNLHNPPAVVLKFADELLT